VGLGVGLDVGLGVGVGVGVGLGLGVGLGRWVTIAAGVDMGGAVGATDASQLVAIRTITASRPAIGPTRAVWQATGERPSTARLYQGHSSIAGERVDYYGSLRRTRRLE
jgi:hypothetical protein